MYENEWSVRDTLLYPITGDDVVLMAQNLNPERGISLRDEFKKLLMDKVEDAMSEFDAHIEEIMAEAFPDEKLYNASGWDSDRLKNLALSIYKYLRSNEMWIDVSIYYDGKRMSSMMQDETGTHFRYNGEPFIEEDCDPRDYFEYVANPHILSMSFEGPFYEVMNACRPGWVKLENEFNQLLAEHGVYAEMGHAWNLTCYE